MRYQLSIIVPAFNEQARLGDSVRKILQFIEKQDFNTELIVVDDGSSDQTAEVARETCRRFPDIPSKVISYKENRGKGYAVKKGMLEASGEIGLFSDADLSTPIDEALKLIEPVLSGECDVTFGSRALNRELIGHRQSWTREQGGKVFNAIVKLMTGMPFRDTQCGFKAFNMSSFRPLLELMTIDRFAFDVEFLFVANFHALRLKEIPVIWNHCEGTKVSFLRDSRKMFMEVGKIKMNAKKGNYSSKQRKLAFTLPDKAEFQPSVLNTDR